jgi:hypothetical protein
MSASGKRSRTRRTPQAEPARERGAEVVRPRRKPEERKDKSPGLVVNKTAAIRRVAAMLVSQGKPPRPKIIREMLETEGIKVSSAQVSMGLTDTEFAYRRNTVDQRRPPVLFPEPALALSQVSIDDVAKARDFVRLIGSLPKAMAALVALGQFGGEQVAAMEQTDAPTAAADYRWPERDKAGKLTS